MCGVTATGASEPSTGRRYRRWSEKFEKYAAPFDTASAPPPYSCTRVRALKSGVVISDSVPSAARRIAAHRPPSSGRDSTQYTSPPSATIPSNRRAPAVSISLVTGDSQEPYGATVGAAVMVFTRSGRGRPTPAGRVARRSVRRSWSLLRARPAAVSATGRAGTRSRCSAAPGRGCCARRCGRGSGRDATRRPARRGAGPPRDPPG